MKNTTFNVHAGFILVLAILLGACSPGTTPPLATNTPLEVGLLPTDAPVVGGPLPTDAPDDDGPTPTMEAVIVEPTPRQGLEATDPATVVLASGQPQIVEFFAFW